MAEGVKNKPIEVTLTIDFGLQDSPQIQKTVSVPEGSTVFDASKAAVPVNTSCKFGMDYFVEDICGIGNDFARDRGWQFEVNGYRSNVPAERYLLKSGDWIKWVYLSDS